MKKFLFSVLAITFLASCSQDREDPVVIVDPSETVTTQEVADLNANNDTYTLYSLRDNKEVPAAKMETDDWDIGFLKTKIIVNGGTARKGKGAAMIADKLFEEVMEAPADDEFKTDTGDANPNLAIPTGSGNGWYTYTGHPDHLIIPTAGKTIVVKTADGKYYAKIQITNYYKGAPQPPAPMSPNSGYYHFKYSIQTDGSKVFAK